MIVVIVLGLCAIGVHEEMEHPTKCQCVIPKHE